MREELKLRDSLFRFIKTIIIYTAIWGLISDSMAASLSRSPWRYKTAYQVSFYEGAARSLGELNQINLEVEKNFDTNSEDFLKKPLAALYQRGKNFYEIGSGFEDCQKENKKYTPYVNVSKGQRSTKRHENKPLFDIKAYQNRLLGNMEYEISYEDYSKSCYNSNEDLLGLSATNSFSGALKELSKEDKYVKKAEFEKKLVAQTISDSVYSYLHFSKLYRKKDVTEEDILKKFCSGETVLKTRRTKKGYIPHRTVSKCSSQQEKELKMNYRKSLKRLKAEQVKYLGKKKALEKLNKGIEALNEKIDKFNNIKYPKELALKPRGANTLIHKARGEYREKIWKEYEEEYYKLLLSDVGVLMQSDSLISKKHGDMGGIRLQDPKSFSGRGLKELRDGQSRVPKHKKLKKVGFIDAAIDDSDLTILSQARSMYDKHNKTNYALKSGVGKENDKKRTNELKEMFLSNPGALARVLIDNPSYGEFICEISVEMSKDKNKEALINKALVGAGFTVGVILLFSGIGAGGIGALLPAMAGKATATTMMGISLGGTYVAYGDYKNSQRTEKEFRSALISGGSDIQGFKDLEKVRKDVKSKYRDFVIGGTLSVVDGIGYGYMMKALNKVPYEASAGSVIAPERLVGSSKSLRAIKEVLLNGEKGTIRQIAKQGKLYTDGGLEVFKGRNFASVVEATEILKIILILKK
jgi:hypothetical protein